MEFNTQICTTREQSLRLLAMGVKPETADMVHQAIGATEYKVWHKNKVEDDFFPAWSLHRLLYMMPFNIYKCGGYMNFKLLPPFGDGVGYEKSMARVKEDVVLFDESQNLFDNIISCYQFLIKNGRINESYLTK